MNVYEVKVVLRAFIQSKPIERNSVIILSAESPEKITLEVLSQPQNIAKLIPSFIKGALRNGYKVSKIISINGPLGLEKGGEK